MKYLVAATAADLGAQVHKRFGHADAFLVVDPETLEYTTFPGVGHEEPHHGIGRFRKEDIGRVIVGNIGPGAFEDVQEAGWEVYVCRSMSVREAIERVHSGEIPPVQGPTMKHSVREGHDHDTGGQHSSGSKRGRGQL
jgi:predicted Fe-Mo cluster-binding NifX family protein